MNNIDASRVGNIDVEGVVLPNTPLSNIELEDAVKRLNIPNFRGCYCINMLPNIPHRTECGVLNLDNSRGDGTHWTAWFKNSDNKIYFDSYGLDPPEELIDYLKRSIYCSTDCIQPIQFSAGIYVCMS